MGLADAYLDGFKCIFETKYSATFEHIIYIPWIDPHYLQIPHLQIHLPLLEFISNPKINTLSTL